MRPKILAAILILGGLLAAMLLFMKRQSDAPNPDKIQVSIKKVAETNSIEAAKALPRTRTANEDLSVKKNGQQVAADNERTPEAEHEAYVEKRSEELMDLAMADDSDSLNTILSELTNRDPQIRKAALEACVQFGSRDAIPRLSDVVSETDDPKEKAEIVEAIEFLKLPSATELIAQNRGVKSVRLTTPKR